MGSERETTKYPKHTNGEDCPACELLAGVQEKMNSGPDGGAGLIQKVQSDVADKLARMDFYECLPRSFQRLVELTKTEPWQKMNEYQRFEVIAQVVLTEEAATSELEKVRATLPARATNADWSAAMQPKPRVIPMEDKSGV